MVSTISPSELRDPMPLFLLACIDRGGLNTLYAFQQKAGIQPGSIKGVLDSLEKAGLVERSRGAKRGRRVISLTDAGQEFLEEEWKCCLDAKRELESIIRSTTVALLMRDIGSAVNFLNQSAFERDLHHGQNVTCELASARQPIDLNATMRAIFVGRRRSMEAAVLSEFAMHLMRSGSDELSSRQ